MEEMLGRQSEKTINVATRVLQKTTTILTRRVRTAQMAPLGSSLCGEAAKRGPAITRSGAIDRRILLLCTLIRPAFSTRRRTFFTQRSGFTQTGCNTTPNFINTTIGADA